MTESCKINGKKYEVFTVLIDGEPCKIRCDYLLNDILFHLENNEDFTQQLLERLMIETHLITDFLIKHIIPEGV